MRMITMSLIQGQGHRVLSQPATLLLQLRLSHVPHLQLPWLPTPQLQCQCRRPHPSW